METRLTEYINPQARVYWPAVLLAGLAAGGITWLLSHGTPWFTSGIVSPTLIGRDLKAPGVWDLYRSALTVLAEIVVSIAYAVIISPLVSRLRGMYAVMAGTLIGAMLYGLNFLVFHVLQGVAWTTAEVPVLVTHLVFGAMTAGIYRGLAGRRQIPELPDGVR